MKRRFFKFIPIFFLFLCILQSWGQDKPRSPGELYDSGMELFYKARYEEAIDRFSKLILFFPASKLHPYSRYMLGQCYLKMQKYDEALQQFELYLKAYPNGDRVKEAEKGIQTSREKLKERASPSSPQPATPDEEPKETDEVKWPSTIRMVKRRICVQIFDLDVASLEEVERNVKALKHAGVDTLIFRVFQNKEGRKFTFVTPRHDEGVYFETQYAPVVEDILGKVAEMAHRNGLDVFAWMTTRYANYGLDRLPEYRCMKYNFETKRTETARGFNLFHSDVLKRLEGLFRDLGRYPIDGVLFQDDLILKHNEDFSAEANQAFFKAFGYLPHPNLFYIDPYKSNSGKYYVKTYTHHFWTWATWKNSWLMNVAKRLMEAARTSNPHLKFGINLYYETAVNTSNAMAWFSQTFPEALRKDFDYYALMAYHRQTMKEQKVEERTAIDMMADATGKAVRLVRDPSKVLMKIQIFDWKNTEILPQKEVEEVLAGVLHQGPVSLAFVPYINQFPFHLLKGKWNISK